MSPPPAVEDALPSPAAPPVPGPDVAELEAALDVSAPAAPPVPPELKALPPHAEHASTRVAGIGHARKRVGISKRLCRKRQAVPSVAGRLLAECREPRVHLATPHNEARSIMFSTHLRGRPFYIGAAGAALLLCAKPGATEPGGKGKERRACENAYKNAVQLEQSAHLRQAKDLLLSCAKSSCGAVLRNRCVSRYTQLEADIPSVVPLVTTETGEPRVDVQVTMDGELLTPRLDGRALPVDPGLHEFAFNADGAVIGTQRVMIVQGQRNRPLNVSLRSTDKHGSRPALGPAAGAGGADAKASLDKPAPDRRAAEKPEREPPPEKAEPEKTAAKGPTESDPSETPPPDPPRSSGPGALPYVIGAAGLAGIGGYGLFVAWGRKDNEQLAQCAPYCSPESVDHVRKMYLAADISLGVGIAALGTAATWLILGGSSSPSPKDERTSRPRYVVDVRPSPAGGFATFTGTF
jgi:hypothetical protein